MPIGDVAIGHAGEYPPPVGTNGLATCVGVAWQTADNLWVVGHVDSGSPVRKPPPNDCANAVAAWVADHAATCGLAPPIRGSTAYLTTASREYSAPAIIAGLRQFFGTLSVTVDAPPDSYLAFYIDAAGHCVRVPDFEGVPVPGTVEFSVPLLDACRSQ